MKPTECYDRDSHLLFEDGRLFIKETPINSNGERGLPKKIDVTEDVVDALLKVINKRRENAYQRAIIEQLKNRY